MDVSITVSIFWLFDHPRGSERQHGHGVFFPGRGCARTPQPQRWMPSGDRPSCLKEVPLAVVLKPNYVLNPTMVTYPVRWYHDTLLIDYIFDMLSWLVHIPLYIQKNVEIIRHNPIPRSEIPTKPWDWTIHLFSLILVEPCYKPHIFWWFIPPIKMETLWMVDSVVLLAILMIFVICQWDTTGI